MKNKENKIDQLKDNYRLNGSGYMSEYSFYEYVEQQAENDPDFFRWLLDDPELKDFDWSLSDEQLNEFELFLNNLI